MKPTILDLKKLQQFNDDKRSLETIWSDDHTKISLLCMKPGQDVHTHTHHGNHIWTVIEGEGQFVSGGKTETITVGSIVIVPAFEDHGIKNAGSANLVIASMTVAGD
jgi:mannose-6-phosphate isomerase-like protein (cupin superfamily)